MSLQAYQDMTPGRKAALKERAKVNLAAAIVLGGEAGFTKEMVTASAFSCTLSTLHAMGVSSEAILGIVKDVLAIATAPVVEKAAAKKASK